MNSWGFDYEGASLEALRTKAAQLDTKAMNCLGWRYGQGDRAPVDRAEATRWYAQSAALGSAEGLYNYGLRHVNGELGRIDPAEACRLWGLAAAKNHSEAMGNLCISYLHGNGVPRDMVQARQWALRSANLGEHRAMALMGNFHRHGLGTPVDKGEALAWYMLSIEGCPDASQAMRELMGELGLTGMSMLPAAKARAEVLRQGIRPTPYRD